MERKNLNLKEKKSSKEKNDLISKNKRMASILNSHHKEISLKENQSNVKFCLFQIPVNLIVKAKRSIFDVQHIASFLNKMDRLVTMLSNVYDNVMDILCLIGSAIKHGCVDGKKVLFRAGDRSDNFYIILEGEVSILIPHEVEMELTEEEYLDHLNTLRKLGENELVKKIISSNKLKEKLIHNHLHIIKSSSLLKLESIIEEKIVNDVVENQKEKVRNCNLIEMTKPKINEISYDKRIPFHIWHYSYLGSLKDGDYFGDIGMTDSFLKRTVTAVAETQCHLGIVHKKIFDDFISEANVKNKLNLVNFLIGTDVFNGIEAGRFSKRYYNMFFEVRCSLSDKILNSGELATHIFFIKVGEFELSMNANLKDIDRMIKFFNADEIHENKEKRNHVTYKNDDEDLLKMLDNKKNFHKIGNFQEGFIFGLSNTIYKEVSYFTLKCFSQKGIVYKIERKRFLEIMEKESLVKQNTLNYMKKQNVYFCKKIKNVKELYFSKLTVEKEISYIYKLTNKKANNSSIVKSMYKNTVNNEHSKSAHKLQSLKSLLMNSSNHNNDEFKTIDKNSIESVKVLLRPNSCGKFRTISNKKHRSSIQTIQSDGSTVNNFMNYTKNLSQKKEVELSSNKSINLPNPDKKQFETLNLKRNKSCENRIFSRLFQPNVPKILDEKIDDTKINVHDCLMIDNYNRDFNTKNYFYNLFKNKNLKIKSNQKIKEILNPFSKKQIPKKEIQILPEEEKFPLKENFIKSMFDTNSKNTRITSAIKHQSQSNISNLVESKMKDSRNIKRSNYPLF